ncbi:Ankyrin repeat [Rickettsia akari str. Hartford]|uniref:Ankyrin repeat n=1 Tax=Rickettsia akari (strain Hartford) TaxID=293614 RepID=A8GP23_RICAH|nr:ankyrin repeat domain-containing protein [Rickettsia akari]ABV75148.1 Ankyrin repeat [Rickettsia akari str. Hartford]
MYKEKYNLSEAASKELFLKLYLERYYLSEEELPEFRAYYRDGKAEAIVEESADQDLLPVIKYFIEKGGNPYLIIEDDYNKLTIFNIAANNGFLDIINYLLDNNIFTVDRRASENSVTPFHSAVEVDSIEAARLLLQNGADVNAEFEYAWAVKIAWLFVLELNRIEMAQILLENSIFIPKMHAFDSISLPLIANLLLSIKKREGL